MDSSFSKNALGFGTISSQILLNYSSKVKCTSRDKPQKDTLTIHNLPFGLTCDFHAIHDLYLIKSLHNMHLLVFARKTKMHGHKRFFFLFNANKTSKTCEISPGSSNCLIEVTTQKKITMSITKKYLMRPSCNIAILQELEVKHPKHVTSL